MYKADSRASRKIGINLADKLDKRRCHFGKPREGAANGFLRKLGVFTPETR